MSSKTSINGHELVKKQVWVNGYRVSVFRNDKFAFQFNVSLQPKGKADELPTYQPTDYSKALSDWTRKNLNEISDWITKETK
jgi:hypothetical protein